jgi:predicted enzyme related to lactoylglutathione lyase
MGQRTHYPPGTPCAVDLVTPDREAAKTFYGGLLRWSAEDLEHGYTVWRRDGAVVAGAIALTEEAAAAGTPPNWTTYIAVADVDAMAARVAELGGTLIGPVFEIPGAGRGAAFSDPQGAVLLLWEAAGFAGAELVNVPGAWSWNDLQTAEPEAALAFYEGLFGWTFEAIAESHGLYWGIAHEGRKIGGVLRATETPHPFWAVYFGVPSVDAAAEQIAAAGGHHLAGPFSVPNGGRFALAADPQGAAFAIFEGTYDD